MTGHGKQYQPKLEWIVNLVEQAEKRKIPIYMKKNLTDAWWPNKKLIQEFPMQMSKKVDAKLKE